MSDATDTDQTDESAETQALPGDGLREGIVDALRDDLGDHLLDTHLVPQDDLWVRVSSQAWATTAEALKAQGFDFFCFLSAIDWMPSPYGKGEDNPDDEPTEPDTEIKQGYAGGDTRFQVFARLTDLRRHVGVTIKADVPDSMTMPTWMGTFAGANWHEREAHEMFGIGFDGHPDLRNLYLPGEFEGFPLRKDFPLLSRMVKPWPGIVDVERMPEVAEEVGETKISADGEPLPAEPAEESGEATTTDDAATDATATADTAAGDAVEAATAPDADADEAPTATDESAEATVVDTPPTDGDTAGGSDDDVAAAGDAVDVADATDDAVDPDGEPATGPVADTIITDDDSEPGTGDEPDGPAPVAADLGEGTVTESTDADPAAPTPGEGVPQAVEEGRGVVDDDPNAPADDEVEETSVDDLADSGTATTDDDAITDDPDVTADDEVEETSVDDLADSGTATDYDDAITDVTADGEVEETSVDDLADSGTATDYDDAITDDPDVTADDEVEETSVDDLADSGTATDYDDAITDDPDVTADDDAVADPGTPDEGSASDESDGGSGRSEAETSPDHQEGSASDESDGGSGRSEAETSPDHQEGTS